MLLPATGVEPQVSDEPPLLLTLTTPEMRNWAVSPVSAKADDKAPWVPVLRKITIRVAVVLRVIVPNAKGGAVVEPDVPDQVPAGLNCPKPVNTRGAGITEPLLLVGVSVIEWFPAAVGVYSTLTRSVARLPENGTSPVQAVN